MPINVAIAIIRVMSVLQKRAEAAGSILVSGSLATSAIYLLLLAVILVRPQGLVMRRKVSSS